MQIPGPTARACPDSPALRCGGGILAPPGAALAATLWGCGCRHAPGGGFVGPGCPVQGTCRRGGPTVHGRPGPRSPEGVSNLHLGFVNSVPRGPNSLGDRIQGTRRPFCRKPTHSMASGLRTAVWALRLGRAQRGRAGRPRTRASIRETRALRDGPRHSGLAAPRRLAYFFHAGAGGPRCPPAFGFGPHQHTATWFSKIGKMETFSPQAVKTR